MQAREANAFAAPGIVPVGVFRHAPGSVCFNTADRLLETRALALDRQPHVLDQVEAVGDLPSLRRTLPGGIAIQTVAFAS